MKVNRYINTSLLTALLIGWGCLLTSCTDHSEIEQPYTGESEGEPLHIVGMTRTGDETSDSDPMQGQSVQLFLDDGVKTPIPSEAVTYHGKTTSSSDLFGNTTTLKVKPGADYYVFGFLPSNANAITEETNGNSSVIVNSETKIATMTIENLPSLSTKDVCVVIGAKGKPRNPYDGISIYSVLRGKKDGIDRDMYLGCGAAVCQQYKLILAGQHLGLKKDFITDILQNPYETREGRIYEDPERVVRLRGTVEQGDAIVPYQKEIPYGQGQKGFVAPKEWKVTEY